VIVIRDEGDLAWWGIRTTDPLALALIEALGEAWEQRDAALVAADELWERLAEYEGE
jgi:hypothetical protein